MKRREHAQRQKKQDEEKRLRAFLKERQKKNQELHKKNALAINTYLDWDCKKKVVNNKIVIKIQNHGNNAPLNKRQSLSPLNKTTDEVEAAELQRHSKYFINRRFNRLDASANHGSAHQKNEHCTSSNSTITRGHCA